MGQGRISLKDLPKEEQIRALDELKDVYEKKSPVVKKKKKKQSVAPTKFYPGTSEDFENLEKVRLLDERGNPVNLEDEEGQNGTNEEVP